MKSNKGMMNFWEMEWFITTVAKVGSKRWNRINNEGEWDGEWEKTERNTETLSFLFIEKWLVNSDVCSMHAPLIH